MNATVGFIYLVYVCMCAQYLWFVNFICEQAYMYICTYVSIHFFLTIADEIVYHSQI